MCTLMLNAKHSSSTLGSSGSEFTVKVINKNKDNKKKFLILCIIVKSVIMLRIITTTICTNNDQVK